MLQGLTISWGILFAIMMGFVSLILKSSLDFKGESLAELSVGMQTFFRH